MQKNGVKTGVTEKDLQFAFGSWIAAKNGVDLFPDGLKHTHFALIISSDASDAIIFSNAAWFSAMIFAGPVNLKNTLPLRPLDDRSEQSIAGDRPDFHRRSAHARIRARDVHGRDFRAPVGFVW